MWKVIILGTLFVTPATQLEVKKKVIHPTKEVTIHQDEVFYYQKIPTAWIKLEKN